MKKLFFLAAGLFVVSGCSKDSTDDFSKEAAVITNYVDIVYASYQDALTQAKAMQTAIVTLTTTPSQANLTTARQAWLAARTPYGQTEAYRFYNGPIDNDKTGVEGEINSWPLDEAQIDYVSGDANAGMINQVTQYPTITKETIQGADQKDGETDVKTGYHAIEFLLWGQDLSATGPGNRPYTDFIKGTGGTAKNQDRRAAYLLAVTELLIEDLQTLVDAWKPGDAANYRAQFTNPSYRETALSDMFIGMGRLCKGELSGERMTVAVNSQDQEDEHSCFSDNTHNDLILNQKGIVNVFLGRYTRVDGTVIDGMGLDDLVKLRDAATATAATTKLDASTALLAAIQPPFDQEIQSEAGRTRVKAAVTALRAEADALTTAAKVLGLNLTFPDNNG